MKRRFVARVRITTSVTSRSFLWRRDATQLISFKTVCYDASFTFIHNSIFKNTYRCRFIHRDLSFLTLFLFTFSICDGHSKFLFKSIKAFNRSFFVVCLEQVCLYSARRKKLTRSWPVQLETAIIKLLSNFCNLSKGNSAANDRNFTRAVQPFRSTVRTFF